MTTRPAPRSPVRRALTSLAGLALPVDCAGCGEPDVALCGRCRAALTSRVGPVTLGGWPDGPPAWAAADYRDEVRRVVVAWKERGRHDLVHPLAAAVAAALVRVPGVLPPSWPVTGRPRPSAESPDRVDVALDTSPSRRRSPEGGCGATSRDESGGPVEVVPRRRGGPVKRMSRTVVLVPVPSSAAARRRRGDRLVLRLALHAAAQARAAGVDVRVLPALRLVRRVADQAGLGRLARAANLDQAMAVRASARHCLSRRRCVVIDDVLTTGVTVREAGRALRAGGAVLLGVVGGCATPRVGGLSDGPHLH